MAYGFSLGASGVVLLDMRDSWIALDDFSKMSFASVVSVPETSHWYFNKIKSSWRMT